MERTLASPRSLKLTAKGAIHRTASVVGNMGAITWCYGYNPMGVFMTLKSKIIALSGAMLLGASTFAFADGHVGVSAENQSVSGGTVTASKVMAHENGWLVVHRVKANGKPGPVVGHAPLKKGGNNDVSSILTGDVKSGDKLMLMVHAEKGGKKTGIFEYTLGAKEDGPIKVKGKLVMKVITVK